MKRRTILKSGATVATAGAGSGWFLLNRGTGKARAQVEGISADDVSVSSNDGELDSLTLDPSLTIEWSNFSPPVHNLKIAIQVSLPGGPEELVLDIQFDEFTNSADGSVSPDIGVVNTLAKNRNDSVGLDSSTFTDPTEGDGPEETDVDVEVTVEFLNANGNRITMSNGNNIIGESSTFTVSVTNEQATGSATVSGVLNTDAS